MDEFRLLIVSLFAGYLLDLIFGDPESLPHPVRVYGNAISLGEKLLNTGRGRLIKGSILSITLCTFCFLFFYFLQKLLLQVHPIAYFISASISVFYGLANKGLIQEGRKVFNVLEFEGLEAGRKQLSRIVGRDTGRLNPQQIRTAVLETVSENLSDGVIAPLFYFAVAGIPGLMTYKMINTLDSMLGYRNERYEKFGKFAARLDDVANLIPARLTAMLMATSGLSIRALQFVYKYGRKHKSPNSGYPEAALAGILDIRFGGPNVYHGILVDKPFIGANNREISHDDFDIAARINHTSTLLMIILIVVLSFALHA
ncbi:adenosylcobinamide-phosphate synthase CbiB [Desertivirga brevis]|uniref:adenosylcobinamide-phosphate synthase CbiB n=1 Tax=Desertivirga brevis TaxID=2810310 RepID=UPI001A96402D|nr:adenosylcobinamide-phosphate synthase CbiB [Pedobacter sp. SYSU D00873]